MRFSLAFARLSFASVILIIPSAGTGQPWEVAFANDSRAILAVANKVAASEASKNSSVVILLEDHRYVVDKQSRTSSKIRKVYRIRKKSAVDYWASIEQEFQPWYEQKPQVRARVIGPEGKIHWLDPKTIAESPARNYDLDIFSDRRVIRAPLPAVEVGSVVEYEITIREKLPLLSAGVTRRIMVMDSVPIERFHVLIEAHKDINLRTLARLMPQSALHRETTSRGIRFECDLGPLEARENLEYFIPPDTPSHPYLSFSTGESWQAVAKEYGEIVDKQLEGAELSGMLDDIDLTGPPSVVAARLTARLHEEIRYTGVEFGQAEIVPRKPAKILQRKYGDCKDKAVLLVAMFRAAGLDSYVALLSSGYDLDVDRDLPGLGQFDHAIVYIESVPPIWIDATAEKTRVENLPTIDQGRLALIAKSDTTELVRTPESEAKDNWQVNTTDVRLGDYGRGEFTEAVEAGGEMEAELRRTYDADEIDLRESIETRVKSLKAQLGSYNVTNKNNLAGPFRLKVHVVEAESMQTGMDQALVGVDPSSVFEEIPFPLIPDLESDLSSQEEQSARVHDFFIPDPHQLEHRYKIVAPELFKVSSLPESSTVKLGPATYTREFKVTPEGIVEALFRFNSGKRRWSPEEVESFKKSIRPHYWKDPELIAFVHVTTEHVLTGQTSKAIAVMQEFLDRNPNNAIAHARYSKLLVEAGLGSAAIEQGKKAITLAPDSSAAWHALGWGYQHDTFGRRFRNNWNRSEAVRCYRKAVELDPEDPIVRADLAILLEHNSVGFRYARGANLDESILLYKEALEEGENETLENNLALTLLHASRMDEAKKHIAKCSPEAEGILTVVLSALQDGPVQAILNAQRRVPEARARATLLTRAAAQLMQMRRYENAHTLMRTATQIGSLPGFRQWVDLLGKLKRREESLYGPSEPLWPVQQLLLGIFSDHSDPKELKSLFASRQNWDGWPGEIRKLRSNSVRLRNSLLANLLSGESLVDWMLLSLTEARLEGEKGRGYSLGPISSLMPVMFVVAEGKEYRILASGLNLAPVGELVLKLLEGNDIEGARWWLDTVIPELQPVEGEQKLPAANSLWSGMTPELRGPDAIRTAAASLIANHSISETATTILRKAREVAPKELEAFQIDLALCEAFSRARKWEDLWVAGKRLAGSRLFPDRGFDYLVKAAVHARKWQQLERESLAKLEKRQNHWAAMRAIATATVHQGNKDAAIEWIKRMTDADSSGLREQLFEAQTAIAGGWASQEHLNKLEKAKTKYSNRDLDHQFHYALAMLQVLVQLPEDALQSLKLAVNLDHKEGLSPEAWVVYGKICDYYGFPSLSESAFEKARNSYYAGDIEEWVLSILHEKK